MSTNADELLAAPPNSSWQQGWSAANTDRKQGEKNSHQSWQKCSERVKIKNTVQICSRVSISSTSSHYLSAPRRWRLTGPVQAGNSAPLTSKTHIAAGITDTHQVWWSLHTLFSPCQRIFQLEKEKLPSGITGEKKKLEEILCSQVVSIRKIYWWPRVHKAQVWCQVPNIKVGNVSFPILHSQPFPLSLTPSRADFDFHSSTKQLFEILSPYKNLGTFVSTFSRVEVAFNSHGFSYMNI